MLIKKGTLCSNMSKWYFTFGYYQPLEHYYCIIEAKDRDEARKKMFERFGNRWSMQYDSAEAAGVERFNLKEVK